jgi:hypothetical protein
MEVYETRELIKILLAINRRNGLHAKSLRKKYDFFTQPYEDELIKLKYVRMGYKENGKFTTEKHSSGYNSETTCLGIAEHGKYVIDCYRKERNAIIREVALCFLSAVIGGLVTLLISL